MKNVKRFLKELKRVRWPSAEETSKAFWKSIIFIIICALVLFGFTLAFSSLWQSMGVGI